uniref:Uncharacterized protein n=1 Tax=viral metagenome TaxID=1070528 RepID=A0A6C0E956_9ZZZZ
MKEKFASCDDEQDNEYLDKLFDSIEKNNNGTIKKKNRTHVKDKNNNVNRFFQESQFHTDYRDVIDAFNNIAPAQKQLFNRSDYPVKVSEPKLDEIKTLVKSFIRRLNHSLKHEVTDFINANSGWDEMVPERKEKSGWEKQQQELGLPTSIYGDPARRSKVKLIKIDRCEKYATEEQLRYVVFMIIQKPKVRDQMVVKVSFVLDNLFDDRKFFSEDNAKVNVNIEEIFILGFMTDESFGTDSKLDDFYNFENVEKDGMIDQEEVLKQLIAKYKSRQAESGGFSVDVAMSGYPPDYINQMALEKLRDKPFCDM